VDQATNNKIVSLIWGIAADVFRDLFERGTYPTSSFPLCVFRRMDAVLNAKWMPDHPGIKEQRSAIGSSTCGRAEFLRH